jgi:hypothetical protein
MNSASQQRRVIAAVLLACAWLARAYFVGPPLSLEKLAAESDIIFKGTVVSSGPVQDEWFNPYPGFAVQETQFTVISVIQGEPPGPTLRFRHYDISPQPGGRIFEPQNYHFQNNRTYIVFARKTSKASIYRQLWANQTGKGDQGVLLCSDSEPVMAKPLIQAVWNELMAMLKVADAGDVTYAISQLDQMSGGANSFAATQDFDRTSVVTAVHDLMTNSDSRIAQAAIAVIGSHNPYLSDERAEFWLATVGTAELPGLSKMDPKMTNTGGGLYWKDLETIASARNPAETRALAIRALGLVREPALREPINRWLADTQQAVRAAATVLLADYPGTQANQQLTILAGDPDPMVRSSVARAIGFSQQADLAEVLEKLLADTNSVVRRMASASLLSFSPKNEAVARLFRTNLENKEFDPLFLNALARDNPDQYLDALARVMDVKPEPPNWWGGEIPAFTSWKILFKYLQGQPAETLRSGKMDRYLDAIEKVGNYSSSEPRDIYAFYLLTGMPERAKKFRQRANQSASYDLDYFFKLVDQNPSLYKPE